MPERSSNSVKIFFADKDKVIGEVREYARRIRQSHPAVKKVGLFGSYATDTYGPASDVDLLIVSENASADVFLPYILSVSLPVDIHVMTPASFHEKRKADTGIAGVAATTGVRLL